ncbi:MAG TPA: cytochrome C oxidase subunit IV family protein [Candidatus Angelobacter sp.]|nr:cytochrome C oxidase subunit IV family protein [Candidatus Angelobacter sp.]
MNSAKQHAGGAAASGESLRKYLIVYAVILVIAGLQFLISYQHLAPAAMLARMLPLAFIEALLAVVFFMHLGAENRPFVISVAVVSLFVLAAMQYSWTDSFRMERLAPPAATAGAPR